MRPASSLVAVIAVIGSGIGCVNHTPAPGELMVEVSTDMSLPKDIDTVRVQILSNGRTLNDRAYAVGPSDLHIPATIGVLAGSDPAATALVRVTAIRQGNAIILREATSQIPHDGVALLQLPLQFLCEGSATDKPSGAPADPTTDPIMEKTCTATETCIAGSCVSASVDMTKLPRFSPALAFGGGDGATSSGTCFDTTTCFAVPVTASVDAASCTVTMPAGVSASDVNLALQTTDGQGICGGAAGNQPPCFVPLDRDPTWGWQLQGTTIQLPMGLCDVLANGLKASVVLSTLCPSKTSSTPPCGPWSSAGNPAGAADGGGVTLGDASGGSSGGPDGSSRTDGSSGAGDATVTGNTCPSAQTAFGSTAQGDSNPNFRSGVGVRTKTQLLIFSSYAGGDAGTDNLVYVQAFDPTTANSLGPAQPLFAAPAGAGFVLQGASVAPTGEIALILAYSGDIIRYEWIGGTSLYAAFLAPSSDAGPAGLALQRAVVGIEIAQLGDSPHVVWSVATGAFVFSWQYSNNGVFVGTKSFLPNGQAVGGIDPVPTTSLPWETYDVCSVSTGTNLIGVSTGGAVTILDLSGNQVGSFVKDLPWGQVWTTVAATPSGFVYLTGPNGGASNEVFIPTSGDGGAVLSDAGAAGLAGFSFTQGAINGHAISDDTGGLRGVGAALLYSNSLSFIYVNADGVTHVAVSVIPHTYADGDESNITNFGGSFGVSLYSAASHSTQVAASGCQ